MMQKGRTIVGRRPYGDDMLIPMGKAEDECLAIQAEVS